MNARHRQPSLPLLRAGHPLVAAPLALGVSAAAATTGRDGPGCLLVAVTVLTGRLSVGWLDDLVDRRRDAAQARLDRPLALGHTDPGTVRFLIICAALLVVPLSMSSGLAAGLAHLAAVATAWTYELVFKHGALSWLPWAVGFGLLTVFVTYGAPAPGPPGVAMVALAAALGVGVHALSALPELAPDHQHGMRHLPLRLALRIGAPGLRTLSLVWCALALGAMVAILATGQGSGWAR